MIYLRHNSYEPNNTLFAHVTRQDNFRYNMFKQFEIRGDMLCGMKADVAKQLLQFMFLLPRTFSRLMLVSHIKSYFISHISYFGIFIKTSMTA